MNQMEMEKMRAGEEGVRGGLGVAKAQEREFGERDRGDQEPQLRNDFNWKSISIISWL